MRNRAYACLGGTPCSRMKRTIRPRLVARMDERHAPKLVPNLELIDIPSLAPGELLVKPITTINN